MDILAWVVIGLVAGWLASFVMRSSHGILMDLALGVAGALVGGFLARAVFDLGATSLSGHLLVAFLGAILLLVLYRLLSGRRLFRV